MLSVLFFILGIHYPQLQMQAGTTGINAMRVYNVTKQGKDQDPDGVFIKKYVCELQKVPLEHIHEPYNMPLNIQKKCGIIVGNEHSRKNNVGMGKIFQTNQSTANNNQNQNPKEFFVHYPTPIVDEKATAKLAKDKLSAVRKQDSTKLEASQVYLKHGSRRSPGAHDRDGVKPKALFSSVKRVKVENGQMSLAKSWKSSSNDQSVAKRDHQQHCTNEGLQHEKGAKPPEASIKNNIMPRAQRTPIAHPSIASFMATKETNKPDEKEWNCNACTYLNEKPFALTCSMCGSLRQ